VVFGGVCGGVGVWGVCVGVPSRNLIAKVLSSSISPASISNMSCASHIIWCRLSISACSLVMYSSFTWMSAARRCVIESTDVCFVTSLTNGVMCSSMNCVTCSLITGVGGVGVRARCWRRWKCGYNGRSFEGLMRRRYGSTGIYAVMECVEKTLD